jgi:hypothetical protein
MRGEEDEPKVCLMKMSSPIDLVIAAIDLAPWLVVSREEAGKSMQLARRRP